jgi:hypothetical protein
MTITNKIIDGLVVILLNISLWQGRKKLRTEDLEEKGVLTTSLPPEKLASLGSKRIVSPDAVNVFMAIKRRAERACLAVGTRFMGGYAVPEDRMPALQAELEAIAKEFEVEKTKFLAQYETTVTAWADENPEWRDAILRSVDPVNYVAAQLQCSFAAMKISHAKGAEKTLDVQTSGLKGQLGREIAQTAKTVWEESFRGKLSVGKTTLKRLDSIHEKMAGLSFLDPSIGQVASSVQAVLNQCKGKELIEGSDLMAVCGILATLMWMDRVRFTHEANAALVASIMPPEPTLPVDMEIQPELIPAVEPEQEALPVQPETEAVAAPQPKAKRTRKPKTVEQQPELAPPAEVAEAPAPAEEPHFTDFADPGNLADMVPAIEDVSPKTHHVQMEEVETVWDSDLPFGGGDAEPIINIADQNEARNIPSEWF